jgi:hypothetical protein
MAASSSSDTFAIAGSAGRASLVVRKKGHGARALIADPVQHGVVVAHADAEIARDHFALAPFRENAGEETTAFFAAEPFCAQRN